MKKPHFSLVSYLKVILLIFIISIVNHQINSFIGYRATGFVFLLFVTVCGLFFSSGPIFLAATLSALIWNYFFIPPRWTFSILAPEDVMMFLTYFVIASVSGFLTLQIKRNQKKAQQSMLLLESEKLHQTLLNCISHELRTPLTAIMGAATSLESQPKNVSENSSHDLLVKEIVSASEQLNHVFENLLDMTRIESGVIKLNCEWFDVAELVKYAIDLEKRFLTHHQIHFEDCTESIYFFGDFNLLEHAFANFLLNAVAYSPPGSMVSLAVERRSSEILIHCKDQGPGIPQDLLPHIFDKFYRLPGTSTGGLGLGLSIAKNLVELHGGRIAVANNTDGGTTFSLILPFQNPPAEILESSK